MVTSTFEDKHVSKDEKNGKNHAQDWFAWGFIKQ
jgi:hypothetical protein